MAVTQPPTIPPGPSTPPQRGNSAVFSAVFEAFLVWFLGNFSKIVDAIGSAYANAIDAMSSAADARNSVNLASSAAVAALATANASLWTSGVEVRQWAVVISPLDGQTYRRRAATGAGTVDPALDSVNYVFISRPAKRIIAIASSATPAPDVSITDVYVLTALTVAATVGAPTQSSTPPMDGQTLLFRVKDNGTARALAWNTIYRASTDLLLPASTVAGKTLYVGFMYNAADAKWDLLSVLNNV